MLLNSNSNIDLENEDINNNKYNEYEKEFIEKTQKRDDIYNKQNKEENFSNEKIKEKISELILNEENEIDKENYEDSDSKIYTHEENSGTSKCCSCCV